MLKFVFSSLLLFISLFIFGQSLNRTLSIIGSSTSACYGFPGGITDANCWVNRVVNYYNTHGYSIELHNLAVSGQNVFQGMPTGSPGVVLGGATYNPDVDHNITKALSFNPHVIIVNYPSNVYNIADIHDILSAFRTIKKTANDAGKVCFITTTQPRSDFDQNARNKLMELKDSILLQYGFFAINFWDVLANTDGTVNPIYGQGDGIHLNAVGHDTLAQRVIAKNIFNTCTNRSQASGNWKNPAVWEKGVIPANCDSVVIRAGHTINVDTAAQVRALYVASGGTLNINPSITLKIDQSGQGNHFTNYGKLNNDKGKILINGHSATDGRLYSDTTRKY